MDEAEFNQLITGANTGAREIQPLPEMVRGMPLRPKMEPMPITNELKTTFCGYLDEENGEAQNLGIHFAGPQAIQAAEYYINALKGQVEDCKLKRVSVSAFPLEISRFDFGGNHFYLVASVNENQKISYMSLIPATNGLTIENKYLETKDGLKLHTVVASLKDNQKRGTVFLKTPYFESNHLGYLVSGYQNFVEKGFNFVLQSNRGAHLSEGDFKWLDRINIDDGYETIDWISGQDFSNGKVMSYGVSYDGYNALAANVSNHPALKTVVACSAPANAATDSFSSNKSMELAVLRYISGREQAKMIISLEDATLALATASLKDWDNILYGRDLGDWDATVEAIKDIDGNYWKERSLIEGLKQSSIETLHVAGLSYDQDSRDTLLAYQEIQNDGLTPEKHRLFLHPGGHGCGGLDSSQVMDEYLAKIGNGPDLPIQIPQVVQFSQSKGNWITGDSYPLVDEIEQTAMTLTLDDQSNGPLASSNDQALATLIENPKAQLDQDQMVILSTEITEDIYINGSIEIKLNANSEAPETRISAKVYYSQDDIALNQIQQYEWGLARTSAVISEDPQEELAMIYPPRMLKISAGTKIYVHLLTADQSHIQALSPERAQFFSQQDTAKVSIFEGAQIILPLEKVN